MKVEIEKFKSLDSDEERENIVVEITSANGWVFIFKGDSSGYKIPITVFTGILDR